MTKTQSTFMAERNSLRLVGLAGFASMASMRVCDPMLLVLGQEFQVSPGSASRVVSAFAVAYGLLQLFYGPLGDRRARAHRSAVVDIQLFWIVGVLST